MAAADAQMQAPLPSPTQQDVAVSLKADELKRAERRKAREAERVERRKKFGYELVPYNGSPDQLREIVSLMEADLSEPYSIFTYRYFLDTWPGLALLARPVSQSGEPQPHIGAIVCKLERHRTGTYRGYIAMLAVRNDFRKRKIGSDLVGVIIDKMEEQGAEEVVLETECSNIASLALYGNLGFIRSKRLIRYYLNNGDAFQLVLPLRRPAALSEDEPYE